jgi:hypothetical protein
MSKYYPGWEKPKLWIEAAKKQGHRLVLDASGELDYFANHNGPKCQDCGQGWCWHCLEAKDMEPCSRKDKDSE